MTTRITKLCLPALLFVAFAAPAESLVEGSIEAGKAKSATCTACHGPEGISSTALWPNIAGQNAKYLVTQLTAFRDGARNPENATRYDAAMTPMSMLLTDEDIRNLRPRRNRSPTPTRSSGARPCTGAGIFRAAHRHAWPATGPPGGAIRPPSIRHSRGNIRSIPPSSFVTMPRARARRTARRA